MSKEEVTQIVENVYLEILERPADKIGLDHFVVRMMDTNDPLSSEEELIALFKLSDEYKNRPLNSLNNLGNEIIELKETTVINSTSIDVLQQQLNTDPVTAPGIPYISSQLATPIFGQYYTGPYKILGGILSDGFRLALEYYDRKKNKSINMRYLENGYDADLFEQKYLPYQKHALLALPHATGALEKLQGTTNPDNSFDGVILTAGYSLAELESPNNINVFDYSTGAEFLINDLNLNSSNVLCVINWSLPFPGSRGTQYQGGATPAFKKHGSRLIYHDSTGVVITEDDVPLTITGDNPNGPIVRIFEIAHPMDGQGLAAYGITPEQSDCSIALDVIKGYVTAGENVNILVRTWGFPGINYINSTIITKGLSDKTICNWWSLPIPDMSMVGMRQLQCASLDASSDFVAFVNSKSATYNTKSNMFSQGVLEAILTVKILDASGNNPTQSTVLAVAQSLALTQAEIAADGFGNLVAGDLIAGLKLSKLMIKTVDENGDFV